MGCPFPAGSGLFFLYSWIIYSLTEMTRDFNPLGGLENNKVYYRILKFGAIKIDVGCLKVGWEISMVGRAVCWTNCIIPTVKRSPLAEPLCKDWIGEVNAEKTEPVFSTWLLCLRTSCPWEKEETWQPSLNCVLADLKTGEFETLGTMLNYGKVLTV